MWGATRAADAPENLLKEGLCQVALSQQENQVPDVPNEAHDGLDQALLQTYQAPALDGERQDEPARPHAHSLSRVSRRSSVGK